MVIGDGNSIISLKDRLLKLDKKSPPPKSSSTEGSFKQDGSLQKKMDNTLINFLKVREENILASKSGFIRDQEEANRHIEELKRLFKDELPKVIDAHKKADPNKVLRFYPFE
ncbi:MULTISPECIES: hypothetical protein [Calditerrivibrio]|uniref:Uncharacterized protein n=1 Tax=Calditerrivibrio nitroreducens TaxID=477976 RepID=A0A2J6WRQ3_9BACT|nr:MAG: hypothetical protein C0187_00005 [Calditerrivibrio nitroreducens]